MPPLWDLTDLLTLLCLHLCPMTQVHHPLRIHCEFSTPTPWSVLLDGLLPPSAFTHFPSVSLLEFPAVLQSLFLQVIAQGILIQVKVCCWEVTFQTSCDFRREIKWADSPVGDKHPGTDAGCFQENAPFSDSRLLHVSSHIRWIWEWRLASSASQTVLTEVINGSNQENRVRVRYNPDGHHTCWAIRGALQHSLCLVCTWRDGDRCRASASARGPVGLKVWKALAATLWDYRRNPLLGIQALL